MMEALPLRWWLLSALAFRLIRLVLFDKSLIQSLQDIQSFRDIYNPLKSSLDNKPLRSTVHCAL